MPKPKPTSWLQQQNGTFRCGNCRHCENVTKTNSFIDCFTSKTYLCRGFANCNTTFVVYRLECECGCFYVGRTKRRFKDRLAEHKYAIRIQNIDYPMAKHYKDSGHDPSKRLTAMVIETIPNDTRMGDRLKLLLQRETYWIHTLKATCWPGLNEEIDFSPFL